MNIDRSPNLWLSRLPAAKTLLLRLGLLNEGHRRQWDPDIVREDIRDLTYGTGTADAVYSSHTLEHLYLQEAALVLKEAARVLRPGGIIRLALPDAIRWAEDLLADVNDPARARDFNHRLLAHPTTRPNFVARLRDMAGGHVHRWQPTPALVADMLREAGFDDVTQRSFREGRLPDLATVETREESFFLEAWKP